ncbi:MAG: alpha/beta hydrolase-fold protein [Bacteroidia bacterium]
MIKKIFTASIFTFLLFNNCFAQLTLIIDSVPRFFTPLWDDVYVAGTFNNWNPGDVNYKLTKNTNGTYSININGTGLIEYKLTRGVWANNETLNNGGQLPNRTYTFTGGLDTVHLSIAKWSDYPPATHTATQNVFVLKSEFAMPQLNRLRRVWIYLPNDYFTTTKTYPVVYMHDGQNVFDAATSFAGEWNVDDSLSIMQMNGDSGAIVVAIDNGGQYRLDEYCPYNNPSYGGGQGDLYVDFLVNTLKPAIDSNFRTKPDRLNTAIAGSSVGAYIALYAGIKYQNVFSKIGSFSPAYWFDDSIYTYILNQGVTQPMRIYQVCSQNEGASVVYNMNRMQDSLVSAGMFANQIQSVVRTYGSHSESFWRLEFGTGYRWLFSNAIGTIIENLAETKEVRLSPNPADTFIKITYDFAPNKFEMIRIFDELGRELPVDKSVKLSFDQIIINTSYYRSGLYTVWLIDNKDKLYVRKFVKK